MDNDLLSEVIGVEKDIQKCLELEKVKSREWLEQTKNEFEAELAQEEKGAAESLQRSLEEAKRGAELSFCDIVKQAELTTERLATLKNEVLGRVVNKYLYRIMPE